MRREGSCYYREPEAAAVYAGAWLGGGEVLGLSGSRLDYVYDFGSSTELVVSHSGVIEAAPEQDARVVARNEAPARHDKALHPAGFAQGNPDYCPLNAAFRLATNAPMPSLWSSVA
ncbi:MAG: hypothetical protein IMZ75_00260, partial [Actinobacteria bacterium]|nr:hypothetical protein [Actinomycetota bacterium]